MGLTHAPRRASLAQRQDKNERTHGAIEVRVPSQVGGTSGKIRRNDRGFEETVRDSGHRVDGRRAQLTFCGVQKLRRLSPSVGEFSRLWKIKRRRKDETKTRRRLR